MKKVILLILCIALIFPGCSRRQEAVRDRENDDEITTSGLKDSDKGSDKEDPEPDKPVRQETKKPSQDPDEQQGDIADDSSGKTSSHRFDASKKVDLALKPGENQTVSLPWGDNALLEITFTDGAVNEDTVFEITPEVDNGSGYPGFHLSEKGGSESVRINYPASICYMTTDEIPEDLRIVKYSEAGAFDLIVPSYRVKTEKGNGLIAFVNSFSAYGVKRVTKADIEYTADAHESYGFDWVLRIDDEYKIMTPDGAEAIFACKISMENTTAPSSFTMQGLYQGEAMFATGVVQLETGEYIDGMEIPLAFAMFECDRNAQFTLLPVLDAKEDANPLAPISLRHRDYAGKAMFSMKIEALGFMGEDFDGDDEGVNQEPEDYPVAVITRGPMAYATVDYPGLGVLTFKGSITGHGKKTEDEIRERIEIAPLNYDSPVKEIQADNYSVDLNGDGKSDAGANYNYIDDRLEYDRDGDGKTDITVTQNADRSIDYDTDGDGEADIILFLLD